MPKKSTGITYEVRTADGRVVVDLGTKINATEARQKIETLPWVDKTRALPGTKGRALVITGMWPEGFREQIDDLFTDETPAKQRTAKTAATQPGRVTVEAAFRAGGNVLVVDEPVRFGRIAVVAAKFLGRNGVSRVLFTNVNMEE